MVFSDEAPKALPFLKNRPLQFIDYLFRETGQRDIAAGQSPIIKLKWALLTSTMNGSVLLAEYNQGGILWKIRQKTSGSMDASLALPCQRRHSRACMLTRENDFEGRRIFTDEMDPDGRLHFIPSSCRPMIFLNFCKENHEILGGCYSCPQF